MRAIVKTQLQKCWCLFWGLAAVAPLIGCLVFIFLETSRLHLHVLSWNLNCLVLTGDGKFSSLVNYFLVFPVKFCVVMVGAWVLLYMVIGSFSLLAFNLVNEIKSLTSLYDHLESSLFPNLATKSA